MMLYFVFCGGNFEVIEVRFECGKFEFFVIMVEDWENELIICLNE